MSDIFEKRLAVQDLCDRRERCSDCPCFDTGRGVCCAVIDDANEKELDKMLAAFGEKIASDLAPGPKILDSGERTEYSTGAVRDCKEGKGRCDLMPLDVVADVVNDYFCGAVYLFQVTGETAHLVEAIRHEGEVFGPKWSDAMLEVAKHFEEGAKKYGPNNWQKGIPVHSYIDSAIRHHLKAISNWTDEPHTRAAIWNLMCCIWTMEHHPELDDFTEKGKKDNENH